MYRLSFFVFFLVVCYKRAGSEKRELKEFFRKALSYIEKHLVQCLSDAFVGCIKMLRCCGKACAVCPENIYFRCREIMKVILMPETVSEQASETFPCMGAGRGGEPVG